MKKWFPRCVPGISIQLLTAVTAAIRHKYMYTISRDSFSWKWLNDMCCACSAAGRQTRFYGESQNCFSTANEPFIIIHLYSIFIGDTQSVNRIFITILYYFLVRVACIDHLNVDGRYFSADSCRTFETIHMATHIYGDRRKCYSFIIGVRTKFYR